MNTLLFLISVVILILSIIGVIVTLIDLKRIKKEIADLENELELLE